jgi:hemerythrin-like metal-binding protein
MQMPLVVWSEALSVGVKSVDDQHTILFNTINDLHAAMMKGKGRAIAGDILKKLLDYTRSHFKDEEELMDKAQWAGLSQHKALHRELTKEVEEYVARYEKGDVTVSVDLSAFLSNWLTSHIQKVDQLYGPWLNERGIR